MKGLLRDLREEFGADIVMRATDMRTREYRSSGSISLDVALGGGWSKGVVIDVVGKQGTGKTLLFDLAAVEAQRSEKRPSVIFDFEHAYDTPRFVTLGGDPTKLIVIRADHVGADNLFVERCTNMLKVMLASGEYSCIGLDSTAAMVSEAEFEIKEAKGEEHATVAYTARAMSSLLRQVVGTGLLARSGATLFVMSQMRDNIGARSLRGIPPPDKRTGGRALLHYASVQVEVVRGETLRGNTAAEKQVEYGHETKVRVRKNKCNAKQGRVAMFEIYTEGEIKGLDRASELVRLATLHGVIERKGRFYYIEGQRLSGFDAAVGYVQQQQDVLGKLWQRTITHVDAHQTANALPAKEIDDES